MIGRHFAWTYVLKLPARWDLDNVELLIICVVLLIICFVLLIVSIVQLIIYFVLSCVCRQNLIPFEQKL
jgi:hypothetical protein